MPKKYIKKHNQLAERIRECCPTISPSVEFKRNLYELIMTEGKISAIPSGGEEKSRVKEITVTIHVESQVLRGKLLLPENERLSDFINTSRNFIRLFDVSAFGPQGKQQTYSEIHINKDAIRMISTVDKDTARRSGRALTGQESLLVQKFPVRTTLHIPDYTLDALLHCKSSESIGNLLEQDCTFLPCTEVSARHIHTNELWHTGFTAVNRKLVAALHQSE